MTDYLDPDHWVNGGDCDNSLPEAKAFAEVIKERDEARAEVEQWKWDCGHISKVCNDKVKQLTKERDEARAEVEQLKQALHDARLENSGQAMLLERKCSDPSRLEIAAILFHGMRASGYIWGDPEKVALQDADKLIAAAKEWK